MDSSKGKKVKIPGLDLQQVWKPSVNLQSESEPMFASICTPVQVQEVQDTLCSGMVAARRLLFDSCETFLVTAPSISCATRCLGENADVLVDIRSHDGDIIFRDLSVAAETQTREIKSSIFDLAHIPVEDQRLFCRGAELHDEDFPLLGVNRGQRLALQLRQRPRNVKLSDGSWFCGSARKHVSSSSSAALTETRKDSEYIFHGLGTMRTTSGECYTGQWRNHQREGEGRLDYANGDFYQGTFRNNQRCGHGRFETVGGDVYRGQFASEAMSGEGELRRATGEVYFGQFLDGRYHGVGRQTCPDGGLYVGQFESGVAHGECVNDLADGSVYEGQFLHGHFDGFGTMRYADGHEYCGHFAAGMMDGEGVYRSPQKNVMYEGQFVQDESHGRGTYYSPTGFKYEGEFCNDMFHGHGALHYADGRVEEGCFQDGAIVREVLQEEPFSVAQVCAVGGA